MNKNSLSTIVLSFMMLFGAMATANASALNNDEIKSLVNDKVVFLKIPVGGEFPLRYKPNGTVLGDGSAVGLAKFFTPKDSGRWWVKDNQLCQKWEEWYKGKTACFVISNLDGKKFRWKRNDGKKGSGRVK
ncbi:MAG: hypothetical protein ABJ081_10020 [Hyphomicrobiales bacterium]